MLFCQQTQKIYSYYHSVTAEPPFICTKISHMHQTRPKKVYTVIMCLSGVCVCVCVSVCLSVVDQNFGA